MANTTDPSTYRAFDALKRGWITSDQLRRALGENEGGISPIEALRNSGHIAGNQLARLFGAEMLPGLSLDSGVSPEEPFGVGDVIGGRYRVFGLAEGGFGRVFFCEHGDTGE